MPYFAVYALDRPGVLNQRTALRPSHRERLRAHDHPVAIKIGGPLLDDAGEMVGTLLVIEAADRQAVQHYLAGDPYVVADLFASVDVRPFAWGLGLPEPGNG